MGLTSSFGSEYVSVLAEGAFGVDDIRAQFEQIRDALPHRAPMRILVEDPGSSFSPSPPEVRTFVDDWCRVFDGLQVRIALCVTRDLHFGLGRMASVAAETRDLPFAVFRSRDLALDWLLEKHRLTSA